LAIFVAFIVPAFLLVATSAASKEKKPPPPTWRMYKASYNRVWNALVRVVAKDLRYAIRAADPKEGYLATWPKTLDKPKRHVQINANVKKSAEGALITVSCIIEEYIQARGRRKGRWMLMPSDHSCESGLLDAVEKRLTGKKSQP